MSFFPSKTYFLWFSLVQHEERKLPVSHMISFHSLNSHIQNDKLPCNLTCNFMQMWRACKSEHSKIEMEDYFETLKLLKPQLTFTKVAFACHMFHNLTHFSSLVGDSTRKISHFCLPWHSIFAITRISFALSREQKLCLRLLLHYFIMRTHPQSRHMAWKVSISMATLCCCVKADKR